MALKKNLAMLHAYACDSGAGSWVYDEGLPRYPVYALNGAHGGAPDGGSTNVVAFHRCLPGVKGVNCSEHMRYKLGDLRRDPDDFLNTPGTVWHAHNATFPSGSLFTNNPWWRDFRACRHRPQNWRWQAKPGGCRHGAFNASLFCSLLGNGRMTLAGDSIQLQLYATLKALLVAGGAACHDRLDWRLNTELSYPASASLEKSWTKREPAKMFRAQRWDAPLRDDLNRSTRVLVLNGGARMEFGRDQRRFTERIKSLAAVLRKKRSIASGENLTVFWVGLLPGHSECSQQLVNQTKPWFQWHLFPTFDQIAARELQTIPGVHTIWVQSMYQDRADGHPSSGCRGADGDWQMGNRLSSRGIPFDCLHWSGGTLDAVWERLLQTWADIKA